MSAAAALSALALLNALPRVDTPAGSAPAASAWCGECHEAELAQWARSRHASAATNRLYLANHAQEPMRWCDSCHLPLGSSEEGIGCAACHVRDGAVLGTRAPSAEAKAAHATAQDLSLTTEKACEGCHQAQFPMGREEPVAPSAFAMQNTVAEWRASGSSRSCRHCHLPAGDHAMGGGHDLARVRRALGVSLLWLGPGELRVTLEGRGVAHAVPTGDPFRVIRVELCADEACEQVVGSCEFDRSIERAGRTWRIARDWSVPPPRGETPGRRSQDVRLSGLPSHFRILLRYVGPATARLLRSDEAEALVLDGPIPKP